MTIRPLRAGEFSIITKHIFILWMIQKKEFKIVFRWGQVYVCVYIASNFTSCFFLYCWSKVIGERESDDKK